MFKGKRALLTALLSCCFRLVSAQGRWAEVALPGQDSTLFRISFVDSSHGWIAGKSGIILATTDRGCTWRRDSAALPLPIFAFKFVSENVGWILASNVGSAPPGLQRRLYRSTDAGTTWIEKPLPDSLYLTAVSFSSETLVRVAGGPELWTSTNSAESWERSLFPFPLCSPASLDFYDDSSGFVGGGWLYPSSCISLLETTDGGASWIDRWQWGPEGNIVFRLLDHRLGMFWLQYLIEDPAPYLWEQLGLSWDRGLWSRIFVNIPSSSDGFYIGWALDSSSVWLLRRNGLILRKAGSGEPWHEDTLSVPIRELLCDTYGHRFALGGGRLFRFDSSSTHVPDPHALPLRFSLSPSYPNPFNSETNFTISIPKYSIVRVQVFNTVGEEVATLLEGKKSAGVYSIRWNADGMPSGVYFVTLQADERRATSKVMLIR